MRGSSVALFPTDHPAAAGAGRGEAATAGGERCCCGEGTPRGSRYCLGHPVRMLFLREAPTPTPIIGLGFFCFVFYHLSFFSSRLLLVPSSLRFGFPIKQRKEKDLCL